MTRPLYAFAVYILWALYLKFSGGITVWPIMNWRDWKSPALALAMCVPITIGSAVTINMRNTFTKFFDVDGGYTEQQVEMKKLK